MTKQMELTNVLSKDAERDDRPKRSKKSEELRQTLGEKCVICGNIFAKRHPIECRCICQKCAAALKELIGEQNEVQSE